MAKSGRNDKKEESVNTSIISPLFNRINQAWQLYQQSKTANVDQAKSLVQIINDCDHAINLVKKKPNNQLTQLIQWRNQAFDKLVALNAQAKNNEKLILLHDTTSPFQPRYILLDRNLSGQLYDKSTQLDIPYEIEFTAYEKVYFC